MRMEIVLIDIDKEVVRLTESFRDTVGAYREELWAAQAEAGKLKAGLERIIEAANKRFSQESPTAEFQSLRDHDSGARLAWSWAARIARDAINEAQK